MNIVTRLTSYLIICVLTCLLVACKTQNSNESDILNSDEVRSTHTGYFVLFDNDICMFIDENSCPIIMNNPYIDGLSSGDRVSVTYGIVLETYPASSDISDVKIEKKGTLEDLPTETMESLKNLGYELSGYEYQ